MPPHELNKPAGRPHLRVVEGGGSSLADAALDFDALFRRYSPYVASIGLRLLGRDDELDDLVQDVFLEAHRGLKRVRELGSVKAWLARICVRRAVRRLRRRRLRAFLSLDTLTHDEHLIAPGASPEARAEVTRLYRKLEVVPALDRAVWVLRYLEGEALDDIATLCACSKSTVQRRLRAVDERLQLSPEPAPALAPAPVEGKS
jgi:RNA polymerase sigma-70 factor (ECF subfamily)